MHLLKLSGVLMVVSLLGCGGPEPEGSAAGTEAATGPGKAATYDYVHTPETLARVAYRRGSWLPALKADFYDDIRYAAPQNYAITEPPANIADVRPMTEWEPMQALVMGIDQGQLSFAESTQTMLQIISHAAEVAEVWIVYDGSYTKSGLLAGLDSVGMAQDLIDSKVKFLPTQVDSIWFIDSGPFPVIDEAQQTFAFADWRYYHERAHDDGIPTILGRGLPDLGQPAPVATYRLPLTVEGGNFQATSDGICFTSSRQIYYMSCGEGACDEGLNTAPLRDLQDNPYTVQMEGILAQYVGCKDLIVTHAISDDGTGHIDMYMKVVDDNTILMGEYREPFEVQTEQANAARLDGNADFLEGYVKPDGSSFTVHRMIMPGHRSSNWGPTPFTYLNSTFINGLNLWPAYIYDEWVDSRNEAQATWEEVMPDWDHVWIDSAELSFWSGAIHCITRTIPAKTPEPWVADGTCSGDTCEAPTGGYTGQCRPGDALADVCYGPEWLCTCNDCDTGCDYEPGAGSDCGEIPYEGCCDGNSLSYCDGGKLTTYDCGSPCGWDASGPYYECGFTGSDPSGVNPRSCDVITCRPDCAGKTCGDDGCGGTCGGCPQGQGCTAAGQCEPNCEDACTEGERGCDGGTAWACTRVASGCTELLETDCTDSSKVCISGACFEPAPDDPGTPDAGSETAGATGSDTGDASADAGGTYHGSNGGRSHGCSAATGGSRGGGRELGFALAFALLLLGLGRGIRSRRR